MVRDTRGRRAHWQEEEFSFPVPSSSFKLAVSESQRLMFRCFQVPSNPITEANSIPNWDELLAALVAGFYDPELRRINLTLDSRLGFLFRQR
jgi:hypothetical protein